jgi:hypothetical protein
LIGFALEQAWLPSNVVSAARSGGGILCRGLRLLRQLMLRLEDCFLGSLGCFTLGAGFAVQVFAGLLVNATLE